jgi:alpha-glucosidase
VSRLLGQIDVETQLAAPDSLLNLYRALIAERQANTALLDGGYRLVSSQGELSGGVLIYDRVGVGEAVRVVLDVEGAGLEITLPMGSTLILSTGARPQGPLSDSLLVAPNEGLLIRLPDTDEVQAA